MTFTARALDPLRSLRTSWGDGLLVLLALLHGGLLLRLPAAPTIALGLWWNSNTVSHNFIHRPFFRPRWMNALFSSYLTVLLGIPQTLWRDRHLAHHAGRPCKLRLHGALVVDLFLVLALWLGLLIAFPRFFLAAYLPGWAAGLALSWLHGRYEHAHGTTSHHGVLYNLLFLNDGYHVEHHRSPATHWTELPARRDPGARSSRWPPVLRWLDAFSLEGLERLALRLPRLQRPLIACHERAFRALLPRIRGAERVAIVGGGLFPRTALILGRLLPAARLSIIESSEESIGLARPFLDGRVEFIHAPYDPRVHSGFDLVVVPLDYRGDRGSLYRNPPAPLVVVHDWIWFRGPGAGDEGTVISPLLLKRLNLVR